MVDKRLKLYNHSFESTHSVAFEEAETGSLPLDIHDTSQQISAQKPIETDGKQEISKI